MYVARATDGMTEATYVSHWVMPVSKRVCHFELPSRRSILRTLERLRCVDAQNRPQAVENFQR